MTSLLCACFVFLICPRPPVSTRTDSLFPYTPLFLSRGMFLDSVSIMLILLPLMLPVVTSLGGDLVWFGVVTTVAVEIGLLTPPFGLSVYVVKGALPPGMASLNDIFAGALPFEIGRAACRERVCHYVLVLVVAVLLKK